MSVEQTSQLIQLILNTVLMAIASSLVLLGLSLRHTTLRLRLHHLHQEYTDLLETWSESRHTRPASYIDGVATGTAFPHPTLFNDSRFNQLRSQQQQLRQSYKLSYHSLWVTSTSVWLLVVSTLLVALRSLLPWQWLISASLVPFVLGVVMLLVGVALAVLEFWRGGRSLQSEIQWLTGREGTLWRELRSTSSKIQPLKIQPAKIQSPKIQPLLPREKGSLLQRRKY